MRGSRKKIIYTVTKGNWGGAQRYVYDLATSLPREQFDVLVVHGEGNILAKKLQSIEVRNIFIPEMGRDINFWSEIVVILKMFWILLKEKPDLIHLNSSKAAGLGALTARLYGLLTFNLHLKIIFTVHGWAFNEPRFNNFPTRFLSWLTVLLSTRTIIISRSDLEQAFKFPFLKKKFILIHNGIKAMNFKDRSMVRNFIAGITKASIQKPWIVSISELHKNKGLEYLIEAIALMDKKPIVFIIGPGEERENLEKFVENLGLEKNIFLMGFIENASLDLKAFDIFTLTSIKEGLPYTVLEAGLAKLPVLASNIYGLKDIIKNRENGVLVEPKNPKEIKDGLEGLLSDSKKAAQLGHKLESSVKNNFSFQKMLEKTTSLY